MDSILIPVLTIGGLGVVLGGVLGYAGIVFKVFQDPKIALVREALPSANCGGCGFAGCDAFAAAVVEGTAEPSGCPVGGAETAAAVAEIMGKSAEGMVKTIAFVKCNGTCEKSKSKYEYYGMEDCTAESYLADSGSKGCTFGCLGDGSCVKKCEFDAIKIIDGIAIIDKEKCVSCGKCVDACPKKLIEIIPYESPVKVYCNSTDNGKVVRGNCSVGCISCKMCEKACEFDAVHVDNFLAKVDYSKCTNCRACVEKCPTKVIR